MKEKSKYARFLNAVNDDLVIHEGRYRAADINEDSHSAALEAGYCAGLEEAMRFFRRIVLEVPDNG